MFTAGFRPLRARTVPARLIAFAVSAALIVTVIEPPPAAARAADLTRALARGTATDFSAARRRGHVYRRHYGRRFGPGPGLAMMGMMIGAIANAERRRTYYEDAPVVYAPQPYYGGYAPGYYAYEPQPAYPAASVYPAPAYRAAPAFTPHVHAGPPLVHAAPQFNVARTIPRFVPQAYGRHHH